MDNDLHVRVEGPDRRGRGVRLGGAHRGGGVDDLALQVGHVHDVVVHDPQGARARGRQVQGRRGAQAPGAYEQDAGGADALLAGHPHLGYQGVATVALQLGPGKGAQAVVGNDRGQGPGVFHERLRRVGTGCCHGRLCRRRPTARSPGRRRAWAPML